ncbi:MAG: hypothetical protein ACRDV7_10465, partial [Acidimicrobiia bacterium]
LTPSGIVILVAAAVMALGSFLPFWELDIPGGIGDTTAWTSRLFFFPVTFLPVLCGVVMALHVGLTSFAGAPLTRRPLGFTWNQVHIFLGLQAAAMMIAFLVQERGIYTLGLGFYLMLIAALGLAIGALMRDREDTVL